MPVEILTFGGFDIKIAGRSVLAKSCRANKNQELLKYFITYRHQRLVPEQIIENLWPGEGPVDPKNALRTQIFRLRRNLEAIPGIEIIFENGFYTIVMGDGFKIDADCFKTAKAEADYRPGHGDKKIPGGSPTLQG